MYVRYDYVLGFQVSVSNPHIMKILHRFSYLTNHVRCLFLAEFSLFQLLIQSPSVHILEDNVKVSFIIEESVHPQNIAMLKATLKTDLQGKLINHHMRFYEGFWNLFQCKKA